MRNWLFGLAVLVVASVPAVADDAADAKAVVEKAVAAHGGADALNKLKTTEYEIKGKMAVAGSDLAFGGKIVYQLPDKYQMTLDLDAGGMKVAIVQTTNGKATRMTVNGTDQKLSDALKAELVQAAAMQEVSLLTPLVDGKKYTLKPLKDAEFEGAKASAVQVSADGMKDVTLYFDQKTGRLVRTSRKGLSPDEKEVVEESALSDYKKAEGVLLPMAIDVTHDGKKFMSLTVTSVKVPDAVDPKTFSVDKDK